MKQNKDTKQNTGAAPQAEVEKQAGTAQPAAASKEEQAVQEPEQEDGVQKELAEAREKLKEAEDQLAKQKELLLRTAAEYDNYRKRTAREKESVYSDATADAVLEFLPVADNLERALEQKDCSAEDLRKGVEMVQKQMQDALKKLGISEMGKEGEPFDPAMHSAVAHVDDENAGENTIAKVFQKGYKIGDKVVRHAMVQVAN